MQGQNGKLAGIRSIFLLGAIFAVAFSAGAQAAPPQITATAVSSVTSSSATFEAKIDPQGSATNYHFEYGLVDCAVGPCTSVPAPEGKVRGEVKGSGDLTGEGAGVSKQDARTITNVTTSTGVFGVGQTISGAGIPAKTEIIAVDTAAKTLTLSKEATASGIAVALTATGPQTVSVAVGGLNPATIYHLRVVAKSLEGKTSSPDHIFATRSVSVEGLPDGRAYEQASPVDKDGSDAQGRVPFVKATASGDGITFGSTFGIPGGQGAQALPTYLASRGPGEAGWSTHGLLPPPGAGERAQVLGWLPNFSETFDSVTRLGNPRSSALVTQQFPGGPLSTIGAYTPEAEYAYAGTSADGATVIFESRSKLPTKEGGPPIAAAREGAPNVYAWDRASGEVHLAGMMNDGQAPVQGTLAGPYDWARGTNAFNLREGGAARNYYLEGEHAITANGDVYFTEAGSAQLYLRRNPTQPQSPLNGEGKCEDKALACTIHVSASHKTNGKGPGGTDSAGPQFATFQAASADGSQVFFTSHEKLTNDANTGPEQPTPAIGIGGIGGGIPEDAEFIPKRAVGVAVDGNYIYWADPVDGTIGRAELDGSQVNPDFIVPGSGECEVRVEVGENEFEVKKLPVPSTPRYVAVDAGHVYWTNGGLLDENEQPRDGGGTIGRADINGNPASIDPDFICGEAETSGGDFEKRVSNPQGIAVNGTNIYWANAATGDPLNRTIAQATIGGGVVKGRFFFVASTVPYGVALNGTHVYFTTNEESDKFSTVKRVPLAGGEEESLNVGKSDLQGIALDSTYIYWAAGAEEAIGRVPIASFTETTSCLAKPICAKEFTKEIKGTLGGLALDGSHLYWSVNGDAPTNPGNDLYRYEPAGEALTDLTVDASGDGAEVQGVVAASKDGSYLYFVANGDLDGTGPAGVGTCHGAPANTHGTCNLYLLHAGTISLVAQLQGADSVNWVATPREVFGQGKYTPKSAFLGDEGRALLFRSTEQLSDYDNEGVPELYLYRVAEPGTVACVSCSPSGEAVGSGPSLGSVEFPGLQPASTLSAFSSRNFSADGRRAFFETAEALVPTDTNGQGDCPASGRHPSCLDVYEWEAPEAGSCKEAGPSYSPLNRGCLYLISTGKDHFPSLFADASESGNDVFFFTRQQLVGQDTDELQDVYDARVGGGLPAQNARPAIPCESSEACHPPAPSAPAESSPGTVTFIGPSNPVPKHKKHKHGKHKKHMKKKHKKKGHKQRRAGAKRRAGR